MPASNQSPDIYFPATIAALGFVLYTLRPLGYLFFYFFKNI